jgi:hypothetical protein
MIPNNNLSVLPVYPSLADQNARKWWIYGNTYPLFRPNNGMPCLQFILPYEQRQLYTDFGLWVIPLTAEGNPDPSGTQFIAGVIYCGGFIKDFPDLGYSVVVCCPGYSIPASQSVGKYYFEFRGQLVGQSEYNTILGYTDVITVVQDLEPYLKIEWWDDEDFIMDAGAIVYEGHGMTGGEEQVQTSFRSEVYLHADIAKPDYVFEEEGETRDGYFYPFKQISEKRYRFKFLACEYLLDVMRFIRMADHIRITYHGQVYDCDTFLMTPEWEDQGDVASVEVEFDTATVAKKVGRGYVRAARGDFNNDFNNDFN